MKHLLCQFGGAAGKILGAGLRAGGRSREWGGDREAGDGAGIRDRDWGRRQGRAILVRHDRVIGAVLQNWARMCRSCLT